MKKNLIVTAVLVAALGMAAGQTIAYFTATDTKENTFTVGNLKIEETEPAWTDGTDGKDMYPGLTLYKDPTVTNVSTGNTGEEPAYFRMIMEIKDVSGARVTDPDRLKLILNTIRYDSTYDQSKFTSSILKEGQDKGYASSVLKDIPMFNDNLFTQDSAHSDSGIYCYNYNGTLGIGSKATLFTNIVIPSDWGNEELKALGEYSIHISVEAIQSKGFSSQKDAFEALDKEISGT